MHFLYDYFYTYCKRLLWKTKYIPWFNILQNLICSNLKWSLKKFLKFACAFSCPFFTWSYTLDVFLGTHTTSSWAPVLDLCHVLYLYTNFYFLSFHPLTLLIECSFVNTFANWHHVLFSFVSSLYVTKLFFCVSVNKALCIDLGMVIFVVRHCGWT